MQTMLHEGLIIQNNFRILNLLLHCYNFESSNCTFNDSFCCLFSTEKRPIKAGQSREITFDKRAFCFFPNLKFELLQPNELHWYNKYFLTNTSLFVSELRTTVTVSFCKFSLTKMWFLLQIIFLQDRLLVLLQFSQRTGDKLLLLGCDNFFDGLVAANNILFHSSNQIKVKVGVGGGVLIFFKSWKELYGV